ncbi:MAG: DUF4157 domain-containing protein [Gemmatimonas sp.]|nr:DUF4157 domain-containing protein [Gemmatimonas sp.]
MSRAIVPSPTNLRFPSVLRSLAKKQRSKPPKADKDNKPQRSRGPKKSDRAAGPASWSLLTPRTEAAGDRPRYPDDPSLPSAVRAGALSGQGKPLDPAARAFFERRVGYSLDRVRIHDDPQTNQAAALLRAHAFTVGERIGVKSGMPSWASADGRFILGHELAHVGQAYAGIHQGLRGVSRPSDPTEVAAAQAAKAFTSLAWGGLWPKPAPPIGPGDAIHRLQITLNTGGRINDTSLLPGDNTREDVLHLLDRLHTLWAITNAQYDDQAGYVRARTPGAVVPMRDAPPSPGVSSPWSFQPTFDAIQRNREPTLAAAVFRHYTGIPLTNGVGRGSNNKKEDVLAVILRLGMLGQYSVDFRPEHATVSGLPANSRVPDATIPHTLQAITAFKEEIAEGNLGFAPRHADEAEFGGMDRFAGRSIQVPGRTKVSVRRGGAGNPRDFVKIFAVFVPRGAPPRENKVHLFFTPLGRPMEFLVQQGLRAQHENTDWILIGVPALLETDQPNFITISTAEIQQCLGLAGRGSNIEAIRMSAHSRGQRGLSHTLGVGTETPSIALSLVERITIFDASYRVPGATILAHRDDLTRMQDPANRQRFAPGAVRLFDVTVGNVSGFPGIRIPADLLRGLAYVRLVQEGIALNKVGRGVTNSLPQANRDAANRLLAAIPDRGGFSTRSPTPPRQVDLSGWLTSHSRDLRLVDHPTNGLKPILAASHLDQGMPRNLDAHHWFPSELAHEAID